MPSSDRIYTDERRMTQNQHVQGIITIVQESRFRLQAGDGRGYLFILHAGLDAGKLRQYQRDHTPVTVTYTGQPDAGAVARAVKPSPAVLLK